MMHFLQLLVLFFSSWHVVAFAQITPQPQIPCNLEDELCGTTCHNPSSGGTKCFLEKYLCGGADAVCGVGANGSSPALCYDPSDSDCVEHKVCPKGHSVCDLKQNNQAECYDPATFHCAETGAVCPLDSVACGRRCYEPAKVSWVCTGDGALCEKGQKSCYGRCYDPDGPAKCLNGKALCVEGQEPCGHECFDPVTESCHEGPNFAKVCKIGHVPCGHVACYSPETQTCFPPPSFMFPPLVCEKGQGRCGLECIAGAEESKNCHRDGKGYERLCPTGHVLCGWGCYDPTRDDILCSNGHWCGENEEYCGGRCWNPQEPKGMKCWNNGTALCAEADGLCGEQCFDDKAQKCWEVKQLSEVGLDF